MVKFKKQDYDKWKAFRMGSQHDVISAEEFNLVCELHARYYKHSFYKPCTCAPKTVNKWISDLNLIWSNEEKKD
jgi:hypothetical protein